MEASASERAALDARLAELGAQVAHMAEVRAQLTEAQALVSRGSGGRGAGCDCSSPEGGEAGPGGRLLVSGLTGASRRKLHKSRNAAHTWLRACASCVSEWQPRVAQLPRLLPPSPNDCNPTPRRPLRWRSMTSWLRSWAAWPAPPPRPPASRPGWRSCASWCRASRSWRRTSRRRRSTWRGWVALLVYGRA